MEGGDEGLNGKGVVRTCLLATWDFGMDIEKLMNNSRVTGGKTTIERTQERVGKVGKGSAS